MFTIFFILIALLILCWAFWFVMEFVRYIVTGEYEMDRRLKQFKR